MRKKLIVLEDSSKVAFGGGQAISVAVISILAKRNVQIAVYDHIDHDLFKKKCDKLVSKFATYGARKSILNSGLSHEASERRVWPLIIAFLSIITIIPSVLIKEFRNDYDIIYSTTKKMFFIGLFLHIVRKNSLHIFHWHSYMRDSFGKRLLVFLMKITSTRVIVPSNFMKRDLSEKGLNISVVENYAEHGTQHKYKPLYRRSVDVAFVGGDQIWKGALTFQKVANQLSAEYKGKEIVFIASGKTRPSFFSNPITCLCVHKLSDFLSDVKIVIFPSESPESFCISAVEAANSGCFVLYNPIGALPEVLADYELSVPICDNDIDRYVKEISKIILVNTGSEVESTIFNHNNYPYRKFESKIVNVFDFE